MKDLVYGLVVLAAAMPFRPGPESIDEGFFVPIHGLEQWITIRGRDRRNPVLLVLAGPGVAMSVMAPFFAPWEEDFTIVHGKKQQRLAIFRHV